MYITATRKKQPANQLKWWCWWWKSHLIWNLYMKKYWACTSSTKQQVTQLATACGWYNWPQGLLQEGCCLCYAFHVLAKSEKRVLEGWSTIMAPPPEKNIRNQCWVVPWIFVGVVSTVSFSTKLLSEVYLLKIKSPALTIFFNKLVLILNLYII